MPRVLSSGSWVTPCACLAWQVASIVDVGFSGKPMDIEQGQTAVIESLRNYVFWSKYDTSGGDQRGVVVTLDVSDPFAAVQEDTLALDLGRLSLLCGIDHIGKTLYCLNLSDGATLNVIDAVTDPAHPVLHVQVACDPTVVWDDGGDGIVVVGSPVSYYVAATDGLEVFDLSGDPPISVATLDESGLSPRPRIRGVDYRSSDQVLFANGFSGYIRSYDLSIITTPTALGTVATIGGGFPRSGIAVYGNYLYAVLNDGSDNKIGIFDVTDPTSMSLLGYVQYAGSDALDMQDVKIAGVCLYTLTNAGHILTYDLTLDPANPIACTDSPSSVNGQGFQQAGLQIVVGTNQDKAYILVPA